MTEHPPAKTSGRLAHIFCLDDFEAKARRRLRRPVFEYVAGGVEDNVTRDANRGNLNWDDLARILQAEIDRDMAMLGINSLENLMPGFLRRSGT